MRMTTATRDRNGACRIHRDTSVNNGRGPTLAAATLPRYKQVAAIVAKQIADGTLTHGAVMPSGAVRDVHPLWFA